jgi:DNA invertase Pin-like site-specific DNA recombinase
MRTGIWCLVCSPASQSLSYSANAKSAAMAARKARGLPIGRPKALVPDKAALAKRMRDSGEPVPTIAATLGVSRATICRLLAETGTGATGNEREG